MRYGNTVGDKIGNGIDSIVDATGTGIKFTFKGIGYTLLYSTYAAGAIAGTVALTFLPTVLGAGTGEIMDHIPYLKDAIPQGIEYIINSITSNPTNIHTKIIGNLDKVGVTIGFVANIQLVDKLLMIIPGYLSNKLNTKLNHHTYENKSQLDYKKLEMDYQKSTMDYEKSKTDLQTEKIRTENLRIEYDLKFKKSS